MARRIAFPLLLASAMLACSCGHRSPDAAQADSPENDFREEAGDTSRPPSAAMLAALGANGGVNAGLDVQIQPVRDQRTLDNIRSGEIPVDLASGWLQAKSGQDMKLADAAFHFVVVVKNTGSSSMPAGTRTRVEARRNGAVVVSSTVEETALNPGQTAFHGYSVDCPDASYQVSVQVTTDVVHAVPGASHAATLDVRTTR